MLGFEISSITQTGASLLIVIQSQVAGMGKDLNLTGIKYQLAAAVFFVS
jgi:hypothetical protein